MNNSDYIKILCGNFNDRYEPLTRAAFWKLYHKYNDSIEEMINSNEEQVRLLLERCGSVTFALEDMMLKGLTCTTFLDDAFPKRLMSRLKDFCPPLLYSSGNSILNQRRFVGYVGSRNITEQDIQWTEMCIAKNIPAGYGIVTGGAKGIDNVALTYAIEHGAFAVVFLPDNLSQKVREPFYQKNLLNGSLLLYSQVSPYAQKSRNSFVAAAMERNKYIYAQSNATVVVRSDLEKGGTWQGAKEALDKKWSTVFIWDNKKYPGNQKLLQYENANALSDDGEKISVTKQTTQSKSEIEQMSLF